MLKSFSIHRFSILSQVLVLLVTFLLFVFPVLPANAVSVNSCAGGVTVKTVISGAPVSLCWKTDNPPTNPSCTPTPISGGFSGILSPNLPLNTTVITGPLTNQTTFTIDCRDLDNPNPQAPHFSSSVTVNTALLPDLTVSTPTATYLSGGVPPTPDMELSNTYYVGSSIKLSTTITNNSTVSTTGGDSINSIYQYTRKNPANTPQAELETDYNSHNLGTLNPISHLLAGASDTPEPWPMGSIGPVGTVLYIRACADRNPESVTESNENNNCSSPVTVTVIAPLDASCSVAPTTVDLKKPATWTATASGGVPPYKYKWTGDAPLNNLADPAFTGGISTSSQVIYPSAGTKSGQIQVTDSLGTVTTPRDCSNSVNVVKTSCDLGLIISPTVVNMRFLSDSTTSQTTKISVFNAGTCSQDISLTPNKNATVSPVDPSGKDFVVDLNYYNVGAKTKSNQIILSNQYAVGVDLTVSSNKIITPGLYTLTITGTGSLVDQSLVPPAKPVITQTVQINVSTTSLNFQEF